MRVNGSGTNKKTRTMFPGFFYIVKADLYFKNFTECFKYWISKF